MSFFHQDASIEAMAVHRVGNKALDEFYVLSDHQYEFKDDSLKDLIMAHFMKSFSKSDEVYEFYHPSGDLGFNDTKIIISDIFKIDCLNVHRREFTDFKELFVEQSQNLALHLYSLSNHPKIKGGEFYVVILNDVQFQGENMSAIALFKIESRHPFLKVSPFDGGFNIDYEMEAIDLQHIDKGAIVLNTPNGLRVLVSDIKGFDRSFWIDDFLGLKRVEDEFQATHNIATTTIKFINEKLDEIYEVNAPQKAELVKRSIEHLTKNEHFAMDDFANEVFSDEQAEAMFKNYAKMLDKEYEIEHKTEFDISVPAVKKVKSKFKTEIKLDKNFKLEILNAGASKYIETGFDEEKGLNFYKVYFENES